MESFQFASEQLYMPVNVELQNVVPNFSNLNVREILIVAGYNQHSQVADGLPGSRHITESDVTSCINSFLQ